MIRIMIRVTALSDLEVEVADLPQVYRVRTALKIFILILEIYYLKSLTAKVKLLLFFAFKK